MASVIDAFNDVFTDKFSILKIIVYSLPVFGAAYLFINGHKESADQVAIITSVLLCTLLSCGINNVLESKWEILTFNILSIFTTLLKLCLSVLPVGLFLAGAGYIITSKLIIPELFAHLPLIFKIVIWTIAGAMIFTSFLCFSKHLKILDAYNFNIIFNSSTDIFLTLLRLIPMLALINGILIGFVWYIFSVFKIPANNPYFIFYCSMVFIFNIIMLCDCFAQIADSQIRTKSDLEHDYKCDNYNDTGSEK